MHSHHKITSLLYQDKAKDRTGQDKATGFMKVHKQSYTLDLSVGEEHEETHIWMILLNLIILIKMYNLLFMFYMFSFSFHIF